MNFFEYKKNQKKILFLIVFAALVIRLFLMIYFESYTIDKGFQYGYETGMIAKAIATGKGFSSPFLKPTGSTAWLMPGYPFLLAFFFKLFGVFTTKATIAILLVNCIVSALTCIPVYYIAKKLFSERVGFVAAVALAFFPSSIWHAINTIWDTTVFTFLAMVLVYWMLILSKRLNIKNAILYGTYMGIVVLVNPVIILFFPFVLVWLFINSSLIIKNRIKYIAMISVIVFLTLIPWVVRNYIVLDRYMLRSNFGLELKIGNSQPTWDAFMSESKGGDRIEPWDLGHPAVSEYEFIRFLYMGEVNYMDQCRSEAVTFIKKNPQKFFRLSLRRFFHFWFSDLGEKKEHTGHLKTSLSLAGIKKLFYLLPLPFMVIGIYFAWKKKLQIAPLVAFITILPIIYYITHVMQRYRYPIEPIILVLACYGFCSLIWREKTNC